MIEMESKFVLIDFDTDTYNADVEFLVVIGIINI